MEGNLAFTVGGKQKPGTTGSMVWLPGDEGTPSPSTPPELR